MLTIRPQRRAHHGRQDRLGAQEGRFQIDGDPKVEILLADAADRNAGVVHQNVDGAEFVCDARRHIGDLRADGDVRTNRNPFSASGTNLRDDCVSILGARLEIDRNRGALLGQRQSDRPADAARGACDERDASLKINQISPHS